MMIVAAKPPDEVARIAALRRYALLDTPAEEAFDRIVQLAVTYFAVPTALVSLIDEDRQWFKARCGLDAAETDRDVAFCAHTILNDDVLVVTDAAEDPHFRDNPLVTGSPKVRFYAGAPLRSPTGHNVGTLCLIDYKPRPELTKTEKTMLVNLAALIVDGFERRIASAEALAEVEGRVIAEHRLAATQHTFGHFMEYAPVAIAMFDRDMKYIAASRRWRDEFDIGEEIAGQCHFDVVPNVPAWWREACVSGLCGQSSSAMEERLIAPDGSERWLSCEVHPWFDESGTVGGLVMSSEGITERKLATEALESNRKFLKAVLDNIQDGIVACDADGQLSMFNAAARRIHGMDERPLLPECWAEDYDLYEVDGRTPLPKERIPLYRALHGEDVDCFELVIAPKSLPARHIVASARRLRTKDGTPNGAIGSMYDITNRKDIEARYRQAQKMEAVGQLTGGLAHDFNNLLAVISGNLQLLERGLNEDAKAARRIASAADAARRGAELTKRLLAFARRQTLEPTRFNATDLIRGMNELLRRTLGEGVDIQIVLDARLGAVRVDESQLEAAILNLSINARDAMPGGGRLTIEAHNIKLESCDSVLHGDLLPGEYVRIAVSDTGCGMSAAVLAKVFDPFFTTKKTGKGSGLGLSMVYGFIKQSGGHVKIYSEEGCGTTITMYLPTDDAVAEPTPVAKLTGDARELGSERILVVEDSDAVRDVSVAMLEDMGYEVVEAADGPTALDVLEQSTRPFDLLFTDVVMPRGMTGPALASEATRRCPALKVLFTSGYAEAAVLRECDVRSGAELVSKPFRREDLAHKVRQALDGTAP